MSNNYVSNVLRHSYFFSVKRYRSFASCNRTSTSDFLLIRFIFSLEFVRFVFHCTAWKVSKYGDFYGPNTGKYGPEKTLYSDTFHAVLYFLCDIQIQIFVAFLLKLKLISSWYYVPILQAANCLFKVNTRNRNRNTKTRC